MQSRFGASVPCRLAAAGLLVLFTSLASAAPVKVFNLVMMQSEDELQGRMPSVQALSAYSAAVQAAIRNVAAANDSLPSVGGFIVVAVRPGKRSNAWLDFEPALPPGVAAALVADIRKVPPLEVQGGPLVFAIKLGFAEGIPPQRMAPSPPEWKAATAKAGKPMDTAELVERAWRD
ncbi:hypothetical protein LRH25_27145 [Ideonella azotifigens]|uniref:Uncharacterized protein n=1 Tax=Ideonella azotifigens TaxID=513160 RepID=A0ABN1KBQ9_9BURK|nr:hypothetical protein [Ideonella azotifigens]MCD2344004.1 hypothetical protein [Ideonella azotifigens]